MITKLSSDIQAATMQKLAMIRTTGLQSLGGPKSFTDKIRRVSHVLKDPVRQEDLSALLAQMAQDSRMTRVRNSGARGRMDAALKDVIQAKREAPDVFRERGLYPNGVSMPGGTMDIRARTNAINNTFDIDYFDNWRLPFYTGR